jgi:hypothetical protein
MFLVGCIFYGLVPVVAPGLASQYLNTALFRPWDGWTSTYILLHPFGYGFVFAGGFVGLRRDSSFSPGVSGGLIYGPGVFVVGSLPVYLLVFASFAVSPEVIFCWVLQSLAQHLAAGLAVGCVVDGAVVCVQSRLPASATRVWELLLRKETFLHITRGMAAFTDAADWPSILFVPGATLKTRVRLFGWGPAMPHQVRVIRVDESQRAINTEEDGGLVRVWNHQIRVEPLSDVECRYTDRIELQAGLLTPGVWLFAQIFYRYRQRRWRTLLQS